MKKTKKLIAFLITLAMILSLGSGVAMPRKAQAADHGLKNPVTDSNGVITWDCVYFGNYYQSDATGTTKDPIKWRVLSVDGDDAFLLADQNLDAKAYNTSYTSVTWETCTLRSWLNGYGASANVENTDYSSDNFIDTAFTAAEQSAIRQTNVINEDNPEYGTEGGNDTMDQVYLLSVAEASSASYGFNSNYRTESKTREAKNTSYAKEQGASTTTSTQYEGNGDWWLRSPRNISRYASYVNYDGCGYYSMHVDYCHAAVRPALHLNLSSSNLWSYAGTVSSEGGSQSTSSPDHSGENQEKKLQCDAICNIEAGETKSLCAKAYESSLEELKKITGNVTWTSSDPKVAQVNNYGFILPRTATTLTTENGTKDIWDATGLISVKGVSEGTATITGTAADGSTTTCEVTVSETDKGAGTGSEGNGGALTLGSERSFSGNEGTSDFFPSNWTLKSTIFPVEISKSVNAQDGSYTLKGSVGIGKSDILDDTKKWNQFKSNVEDARKYTGKIDCLKQYKKTWNIRSVTALTTDKFEKLPEVSVMGYFENTYDRNGNIVSQQGGLAADASWKGSISWQFVTPIGPLYMNLSGGGSLSGNIQGQYDYTNKKYIPVGGSLKITPSISLEGGYGIDKVATIGAQGTLAVPITLIPASKGEFSAKAALHVKLIFVIDYTHDLASYTKTIWDTTGNKKSAARNVIRLSEGTFSEMDTSFAKAEGKWNPNCLSTHKKKALLKKIGDTIADNITVLQTGILPSSLPKQIQIGSKKVMIFQAYDKERATLNSSVLKYSVYDNGTWSEPKAVSDDGTADLYADMKVADGKLVLAWQKEKSKITGDLENDSSAVLKDMAECSEIYFSEFDEETNTFTDPVSVTDNDDYDCMPRICSDSDDIVISWVRNDSSSLMQTDGINKIYTAKWNGTSFEKEQKLSEAPGTIDDYVVYQKDGEISAIYTGQANNIKAVFDTNGQVITQLTGIMTSTAEGNISGLQYADGNVSLVSGENLYQYNISEDSVQSFLAGESAFGAEAKYCTNGQKSGYIWSEYDEETDTGKLVASMETEDGYSEPVTLCEQEGIIWRYYSPLLEEDGTWQIAANVQNTETDINSLVYVRKEQKTKLELAGASIDEDNTKDGLTAVDYFVENTEDTAVDQIEISIKLKDGNVIKKSVSVKLQPGESLAGTAYVDLSDVNAAQDVTISVYGDGQEDISNCEVSGRVGLADLAVKAAHEEADDEIRITAALENTGAASADASLYLYGDEQKTEILQQKEEMSFSSNESQTVTFTVKKKDISYNENNAAYLTLYAQAKEGDYNEDNNTAYVILYREDLEPSDSASPSASPSETPDGTLSPVSTKAPTATPTAKPTRKPSATSTAKPTKKPSSTPEVKTTKTPDTNASTVPSSPIPAPSDAQTSSSQSPAGTQQPSGSSGPAATIRPGSTGTPSVTAGPGMAAAVSPSPKTTVSPSKAPATTQTLRKGQIFKNVKTKAYYKILSVTATGGKVAYLRPIDKKVKKVTIRDTVTFKGKKFKITQIGNKAFKDYKKLQKVTIGRKVSVIGKKTFANCKSLKVVILTGPKQKLPKNAFAGCPKKPKVRKTH